MIKSILIQFLCMFLEIYTAVTTFLTLKGISSRPKLSLTDEPLNSIANITHNVLEDKCCILKVNKGLFCSNLKSQLQDCCHTIEKNRSWNRIPSILVQYGVTVFYYEQTRSSRSHVTSSLGIDQKGADLKRDE